MLHSKRQSMRPWVSRLFCGAAGLGLVVSGCASFSHEQARTDITPIETPSAPMSRMDGYYYSAVAAIERKDYSRALEALQAARQLSPSDVRVINAFGVVYDKLGRFDLSARYYAQAKALDANSPVVQANMAYSAVLSGAARGETAVAAAAAPPPPAPSAVASPAPASAPAAIAKASPPTSVVTDPAPVRIAPPVVRAAVSAPIVQSAAPPLPASASAPAPVRPTPPLARAAAAPSVSKPVIQSAAAPAAPQVKQTLTPTPAARPRLAMANAAPPPVSTPPAPAPATKPVSPPVVAKIEPPPPAPRRPVEIAVAVVKPSAPPPARPVVAAAKAAPKPRPEVAPSVRAAAPAPQPQAKPAISIAKASVAPITRSATSRAPAPPAIKTAAAPKIASAAGTFSVARPPLYIVNASGQATQGEPIRVALASKGWSTPKWALQQGPTQTRSVIHYPPSRRPVALALAMTLPSRPQLAPCKCAGLRLVLGSDAKRWRPMPAAKPAKLPTRA